MIGKVDTVEQYMSVGNEIIIFDEVSDYASLDIATLANPKSLGNIEQDSINYTGTDATFEEWKNEDGVAISSTTEAGTIAFEFNHMSFTSERAKLFMSAVAVNAGSPSFIDAPKNAVGFGHKVSVITRPLAFLNQETNKWMLIPRAKISTSMTINNKHYMMKSTVQAEFLDTENLKTCVLIDGAAKYTE